MLATQAAARLTAAEQNIFQQTAALPRLNQNAVCFRLGNGPIEATSTARPERLLECRPCSKQPNDPPGQDRRDSRCMKKTTPASVLAAEFSPTEGVGKPVDTNP